MAVAKRLPTASAWTVEEAGMAPHIVAGYWRFVNQGKLAGEVGRGRVEDSRTKEGLYWVREIGSAVAVATESKPSSQIQWVHMDLHKQFCWHRSK